MAGFSGGDIPQLDEVVVISTTGECLSIRTERNALDIAGVSLEGLAGFAGGYIPQPDGADDVFRTPRGKGGAIRTERNAPNTAGVSGEQCHFVVGCCIVEPNPDGSRNGEQCAIGRIRNLVDAAFAEA